ncbi:MAG: hypothetical protein U0793_07700 [Gemmataceae bacterium]
MGKPARVGSLPTSTAPPLAIGPTRTTIVRWFSKDGKLRREIAVPGLIEQPGFLRDTSVEGVDTVHAVNGDWNLVLGKDRPLGGYLTGTADSRTLVHQFHPAEGQIAFDIYRDGKMITTIGAFTQYRGRNVRMADDGAVALTVWKGEGAAKAVHVVVAGGDGKNHFIARCEEEPGNVFAAPSARGVLVRAEGNRASFAFYTPKGKRAAWTLGPDPDVFGWTPDGAAVLLRVETRGQARYHLIDAATGKTLWERDDPSPARVNALAPSVILTKDLILISGRELHDLGGERSPVRCIHALDRKTGTTVATWRPSPLSAATDEGRLLMLDRDVYYVMRDRFSRIRVEDVAAKKEGWK